jgi:hypothetical protein
MYRYLVLSSNCCFSPLTMSPNMHISIESAVNGQWGNSFHVLLVANVWRWVVSSSLGFIMAVSMKLYVSCSLTRGFSSHSTTCLQTTAPSSSLTVATFPVRIQTSLFFSSHPVFHSIKSVLCRVLVGRYGSSLVTQCLPFGKQIINSPRHTRPVLIRALTTIAFPFSWQHSLS